MRVAAKITCLHNALGRLGSTPTLLAEYGNGSSSMDGRREYIWLPQEDGQAIPIGLYRGIGLSAFTPIIWALPARSPV